MRTNRLTKNHQRLHVLGAGLVGGTLLLTAACSGQAEPDAGTADDSSSNGEQVTIRFVGWGNESRVAATDAAVDEFMAQNPDVEVEVELVDFASYFDRLSTSVAAGDVADILTLGGPELREYASRGVVRDLATLSDLDLDALDEAALANVRFDGVQYGAPAGVNALTMLANPEVLEAAGLEMPDDTAWCWDDYADLAAQVSANTPEGTYGSADPTGPEFLDLYADQQTGDNLYSEEGDVAVEAGTVEDWFALTQDMTSSGALPPASLTQELQGAAPEQSLLGQGQAAFSGAWSNQLTPHSQAAGVDLATLLPPGEGCGEEPGLWLQAGMAYTVSEQSEHPEAAARLINFLLTSPDAAIHTGADRGIPANAEIRDFLIGQGLEPVQEAEYAYIDRVSQHTDGDYVVGPAGAAQTRDILQRTSDAVRFGQLTPASAGEQFVTEVAAAVSQ